MKQYLNTHFFNFFHNAQARLNFVMGGGGSGKSHSLQQFFALEKFLQGDHLQILVTRKTMTWLRLTAYRNIVNLLDETIGEQNYGHKKTESYMTFGTNLMQFAGLDDSEKIKSTEWHYIFAEELTDYTQDDFQMLNMRLHRSSSVKPQLFGAFNPIDAFHWIKARYYDKPEGDYGFNHSTYRHNPFCNDETKKNYRSLKEQDYQKWLIYSEGIWGVLENLIYKNYDVVDKFPEHFDEKIYGYDFGFTNPSAIVEIGILDGEYYLQENLYESGLTSSAFVDRLNEFGINKDANQYGDSNRNDYIDEIEKAGYNIRGAEKGPGSVITGIDIIKKSKLHILSSSLKLLDEIRGYNFKQDRQGHVKDEPVKFNDHLMDALRYAIVGYQCSSLGIW
jgi:phage terminase large subunit